MKLHAKIEIFRKFAWKRSNYFGPGSTTPRFQTRLTRVVDCANSVSQCSIGLQWQALVNPQILGRGVVGGREGSWTGREILLYFIMYIRKWWLLKRNRIICQEVAVNSPFWPGNSIFFKFPEKSKFVLKFAWKNRNF